MDTETLTRDFSRLLEELRRVSGLLLDVEEPPDLSEMAGKHEAVKSSIKQLEEGGVPVPSELRQVAERFEADVGDAQQLLRLRRDLADAVAIESKRLAGFRTKARRRRGSPTRTRRGSIVQLADLIREGLVKEGQRILHHSVGGAFQGHTFEAVVLGSGEIEVEQEGVTRLFTSPSGASLAVTERKAFNGWEFWRTVDEHGQERRLIDLRRECERIRGQNPASTEA